MASYTNPLIISDSTPPTTHQFFYYIKNPLLFLSYYKFLYIYIFAKIFVEFNILNIIFNYF